MSSSSSRKSWKTKIRKRKILDAWLRRRSGKWEGSGWGNSTISDSRTPAKFDKKPGFIRSCSTRPDTTSFSTTQWRTRIKPMSESFPSTPILSLLPGNSQLLQSNTLTSSKIYVSRSTCAPREFWKCPSRQTWGFRANLQWKLLGTLFQANKSRSPPSPWPATRKTKQKYFTIWTSNPVRPSAACSDPMGWRLTRKRTSPQFGWKDWE